MKERYPLAYAMYPRALALVEQKAMPDWRAERLEQRAARILAKAFVRWQMLMRTQLH